MKIMTAEYKIGDVVKVKIEGEMITCIILSDLIKGNFPRSAPRIDEALCDINYLTAEGINGYEIRFHPKVWLDDCYEMLIGDQIVHVEVQEISE